MTIVGYAQIAKKLKTKLKKSAREKIAGQVCMVLHFAEDGSVLVTTQDSSINTSILANDVKKSFNCNVVQGIITPPYLYEYDRIQYCKKWNHRPDYITKVRPKLIRQSLEKGVFCDDVEQITN